MKGRKGEGERRPLLPFCPLYSCRTAAPTDGGLPLLADAKIRTGSPLETANLWPRNRSSRDRVADRRSMRRVIPDTPILCLRTLVLMNNMGAVTKRDSSVTGRPRSDKGVLLAEECGWRRYLRFQKRFPHPQTFTPM